MMERPDKSVYMHKGWPKTAGGKFRLLEGGR